MVRFLKFIFSFLLIFSFAVTLGSEVFNQSSHISICSGENLLSFTSDSEASQSTHCQSNETQDECPDPCHKGQCHFGHCSFISSHTEIAFPAIRILNKNHFFFQNLIAGPVLEGPRRPPRLA